MAVAVPTHDHGHRAGTPLDQDLHEQQIPVPSRWASFGVFLFLAIVYSVIGYRVTIDQHVVVFDALDRLTRSYLVWHNAPPKLAAVGFLFPPLTTLAYLPFTLVKPLATSLIALPVYTAIFAAATVMVLDRTLARCDMASSIRLPLLVLFAFNPFWVFYATNGMSEAVYSFFLAFSLYCFVSWYASTEPRFLIGSGFGLAFLVLMRYAFIIWAVLLAVLIAVALVRRNARKIEVEGSVVAFAAPIIYTLALWILFNALIVGDPFGWLSDSTTSTQAVNSTGLGASGHLAFNEIATRLLQLNVAIFPTAFVVVPALVIAFIAQRNDMALWLAAFVVLGIVIIGVHAYTAQKEGLLTLRDSMPMYVATFVGAGWLFRSLTSFKIITWLITLGLMVLNLFTAWHGMQKYPFQSQEQAFIRAIKTGDDQEGTSSRGGYTVGIASEARMADYIDKQIPQKRNSILADNAQTFGVILLSGRPGNIFDRADKGDAVFRSVVAAPWGKVSYLLITRNNPGDLIYHAYPKADSGAVRGLDPVFRTPRYVLVKVAARDPNAPVKRTPAATAAATPTATTATATTP